MVRSITLRRLTVPLASLSALVCSTAARAEDSIIKRPGDHPDYGVEIEPHLAFSVFDGFHWGASGYGLGGRLSIPVVKNGFVKSINNNVAIGFGADYLWYDACYWHGRTRVFAACDDARSLFVPIVMQWNFFLSTHWSVFGEPGIVWWRTSFGSTCYETDRFGNPVITIDCGHATGVDPAFFVGGRYHFSDGVALTMRIGTPYASVGVSFM